MAETQRLFIDHVPTPIGTAVLVADEAGALHILNWEDDAEYWQRRLRTRHGGATVIPQRNPSGHSAALSAFMEGDIGAIDGLSVAFGGTPFQNQVWRALRTISGGTTLSYGALARQIGSPSAVRAVGLANGANPVSIVVPCHRVIGSNGSLTGYGGGLPRKRWLLDHEARHAGTGLFARRT